MLCLTTLTASADPLSSKRGFGDVNASYDYLQAVNAGWYYGWRPDKPAGAAGFDAEFVPMIWGAGQANQFEIDRILDYGDVDWVLGFNEPERSDQANLTVGQAIDAWRTLSTGFSGTDVKLVSPGVADTGGDDGGQTWLSDFMSQANAEGLKVDGVAFHWYGVSTPDDPIGAANSFISRVDSYHNSYGLPVWITEFAIHDWGGSYTDEEVRAANAVFLENVIPRLEDRSYVEGYAFYNWFGDSALVEGSPLTPTNVGQSYVGVIEEGQVYNLSGVDMGEHVAYLTGGQLTHTGASNGAVRYINALSNTSHLTGTTDWGLSEGNWLRVQTGATLRKSGANQIVLDQATITNDGKIVVDQGELVLRSRPTLTGAGAILVEEGATLQFDGAARGGAGQFSHTIELRGGTVTAPPETGVIAHANALLSGHGVVSGGLVANAGATIRVGSSGLSTPQWLSIDNFDEYSPGALNAGVTDGVWTGVFDGTANARIVAARGAQSLEFYGAGDSWRGARTKLDTSFAPEDHSLEDGDTATYFFRVQRQGSQSIDGIFGLTDLDSIGVDAPWSELAITLSLFQGNGANDTTALRAYDGSASTDLVVLDDIGANEWINVWLVVDNDNKSYRVATSTGTNDGVLFPNTLSFGRQTAQDAALDTFAGAEFRSGSNPTNASVRVDDLVYLTGSNLTNPLNGMPGVIAQSALLRVEGDFDARTGSTLEIDLYDPMAFDRLEVTGALNAGGTLLVSLDPHAPDLMAGDAFDLLDFATLTGEFDLLSLPSLNAGLFWDASQLYATGVLSVSTGIAGDYNADGVVDAADYTVWRDNLGAPAGTLPNDADGDVIGVAQYNTWRDNYGRTVQSGLATSGPIAVPEPNTLALFATFLVAFAKRSGNERRKKKRLSL